MQIDLSSLPVKMRVMRPILIATACLLVFCLQISVRSTPGQNPPDEEYAVFSVVIRDLFAGYKVSFDTQQKVKLLVIRDHTSANRYPRHADDWKEVKEMSPAISNGTISDYIIKNKDSRQLTSSFDIKLKYSLISTKEIDEIFKTRSVGWPEYYRKYPESGGYVEFSRVGFNAASTEALVYFEHSCGELCASGHYLLLTKGKNGWQVENKRMVWIS
jgi:hypothetical protein